MSDDGDNNGELRWRPYVMLALGALFIILGIANAFMTHEPEPWNNVPDWWVGAPTSAAPFSLLLGIILCGAGAYILKRQAK